MPRNGLPHQHSTMQSEQATEKQPIENVPLPELQGKTSLLNDTLRTALIPELPSRARFYPWNLVYSTTLHGFSLKTLYRRMLKLDFSTMMIIQDAQSHIFGAIVPCGLKVAEHFYGTGESALFTCSPDFKVRYEDCSYESIACLRRFSCESFP